MELRRDALSGETDDAVLVVVDRGLEVELQHAVDIHRVLHVVELQANVVVRGEGEVDLGGMPQSRLR